MLDGNYLPSAEELTRNGSAQAALQERAAETTRKRFGARVFVRAVVELSNYCRQRCAYCGMSRDNRSLHRVRAHLDQLTDLVLNHRPACVTDINLQAGEDPVAVQQLALPLVRTIRRETSLGVSVCLGILSPDVYRELKSAGASIYIMKFECANADQYARFQAPGTLSKRIEQLHLLARAGWAVSSGFIAGLPGQTANHMLENLQLASQLPLRGCSVSPFIPGENTPLADVEPANVNWSLNCIAAMRLMRPDWVIPAVSALNLTAADGYRRGLRSGANLVTINMTPEEVREDYIIYKRDRFIMTEERILTAISAEGLRPCNIGLAQHYAATSAVATPAETPSMAR